jgi:hypothetical protein
MILVEKIVTVILVVVGWFMLVMFLLELLEGKDNA